MSRSSSGKSLRNRKKAQALFRKLRQQGVGDRFKGMSGEEIIQAIKHTREVIWQEKLAARP